MNLVTGGPVAQSDVDVVEAVVQRRPFVAVSGAYLARTEVRGHRRHWIPVLDDDPPACGVWDRLETYDMERWCLLPEYHAGPHGFEPRP